jgi:hypothetical protein
MKIRILLKMLLALGFCSSLAVLGQEQTNEFQLAWTVTGYSTNGNGTLMVTNVSAKTLVDKVAADNGLNPNDLIFVYRVEKRDTAVVYRTNGQFVSDVYQMEYTWTDVTNRTGAVVYRETLLNDEYHTNAIGTTWGVEDRAFNKAGYLTSYLYHGTVHYFFPETGTIFTGSFTTGARVKEKGIALTD